MDNANTFPAFVMLTLLCRFPFAEIRLCLDKSVMFPWFPTLRTWRCVRAIVMIMPGCLLFLPKEPSYITLHDHATLMTSIGKFWADICWIPAALPLLSEALVLGLQVSLFPIHTPFELIARWHCSYTSKVTLSGKCILLLYFSRAWFNWN
jgi:hypothetical protein